VKKSIVGKKDSFSGALTLEKNIFAAIGHIAKSETLL